MINCGNCWKVFRIGTVCYNWPMSAHASQAFSIVHCTDSEDLPNCFFQRRFNNRSSAQYTCMVAMATGYGYGYG